MAEFPKCDPATEAEWTVLGECVAAVKKLQAEILFIVDTMTLIQENVHELVERAKAEDAKQCPKPLTTDLKDL